MGQCATDDHSTSIWDSWKSCETTQNPATPTTSNHWILYNLGAVYELGTSQIWNYNVANETGQGIKTANIQVSTDGEAYTDLGNFEFEEATGLNDYDGFTGPDFGNVEAQYILITAIENFDNTDCVGLSEIKINLGDGTEITGIEKVESLLTISPNPATNFITINFSNTDIYDVYVYDTEGTVVAGANTKRFTPTVKVDIASNLANGVYLVHIFTEKGNFVEQVTVQR